MIKLLRAVAICFAFASLANIAVACSTAILQIALDDARDKLDRARKADTLENAQYETRKARGYLEDAALYASMCECWLAYTELDSAASYAKKATNADTADEFAAQLRKAIRSYNDSINYLSACEG